MVGVQFSVISSLVLLRLNDWGSQVIQVISGYLMKTFFRNVTAFVLLVGCISTRADEQSVHRDKDRTRGVIDLSLNEPKVAVNTSVSATAASETEEQKRFARRVSICDTPIAKFENLAAAQKGYATLYLAGIEDAVIYPPKRDVPNGLWDPVRHHDVDYQIFVEKKRADEAKEVFKKSDIVEVTRLERKQMSQLPALAAAFEKNNIRASIRPVNSAVIIYVRKTDEPTAKSIVTRTKS